MKKQILAGILSATMVVGMGGVSVFAADKADDKTVCFNEIKGMEAFFCQISPEPAPDLCKQVRGKFRYWRQAFQDQGSKI